MKIFKILMCSIFVLILSACNGKNGSIYEYPDDDNSAFGEIGAPCEKNGDCKSGLVCTDKVCSKPVSDEDPTDDADTDTEIEDGENDTDTGDNDTEPTDDADTDIKDDNDTEPTDDADSGKNDEDEPEDSDLRPDNDTDNPEYVPECGNGARDPGEECDNGANNSNEPGIPGVTCRTGCTFARCGDGIKDQGEICDDGNPSVGDYCSPDCQVITGYCGDGIQQTNEVCDKAKNPYCNDDCTAIDGSCGDGKINGNEVCDNAEPDVGDGEGIGPYYCNVNCTKVIGSCGDGNVQLNEKCDDGNNNGRYGYCKADCSGKGPYCGDGIVQINEKCDKAFPGEGGGEGTGVYCSDDCKTSKGSCGDGIIQREDCTGYKTDDCVVTQGVNEACDKATYHAGTGIYCSDNCLESYGRCGDGERNKNSDGVWLEECDNGDFANDNPYCPYGSAAICEVCNRACKIQNGIPRYCGDGIVSTLSGEECDTADLDDPKRAYCKSDCTQYIGSCGDGILQPGIEECDPGIDPYCSDECKLTNGYCGDGERNGNEECDHGDENGKEKCPYGPKTACTVCDANCKNTTAMPRYCGDGLFDEGYEICDSGSNGGNYGECKADCSGLAEHCGDGIVQGDADEECDNGDNNGKTNCAYGTGNCKVCTAKCKEIDGIPASCGDGIIQREDCAGYGTACVVTPGINESCDDGENNGDHGYCAADCHGEGERCGDGFKNGNEICDDGDANNGKYGFCASDCMSLGRRCGDGILDEANGEWCDDGENNGKYRDYYPGYCREDCLSYGGYCGDSVVDEGHETCDDGTNNTDDNCPYDVQSCEVCVSCMKRPGKTSYCGDHKIDWMHDEVCDEGENNTDYNGTCNKDCSGEPPKCGDGTIDTAFGELCDDREHNGEYSFDGTRCSEDCKSFGGGGWCGDEQQNGYEVCDSGAMNGRYGNFCNESCSGYTHFCGDGNLDDADGENCDDSSFNGTYGKCDSNCLEILECGDGIWQNKNCLGAEGCVELDDAEEECDLGLANGTTTNCVYGDKDCSLCTNSCTSFKGDTAYCDDGIIQREDCEGRENCVEFPGANEECDDGEHNGEYGYCAKGCGESMPKCGDGKINRENCDGYGENCVVTEGINEECDDGTENGTYGKCNGNCTGTVRCGDGATTDGELCDNGMMNGTYNFCNDTCTGPAGHCGDGIPQHIDMCNDSAFIAANGFEDENDCRTRLADAAEACDDGSFNYDYVIDCEYGEENCTYCTKDTCTIANGKTSFCGDGETDSEHDEFCDEGKALNGQFGHCDELCKEIVTWQCGDGTVDNEHGEVCDDGILNNTDGYCNATCDGWTPYCGDGIIQRGNCDGYGDNCMEVEGMTEECDSGINNNNYGFCKANCEGMREERCGDGIIHRSECIDYSTCNNKPCSDPSHTPSCRKAYENDKGQDINCDDLPNCVVVPGSFEVCDEGDDIHNLNLYKHCNSTCSGTNGCGDGKVQKGSAAQCTAYIAADPTNRKLCSEEEIPGCCEVVNLDPGDSPETCDEGDLNNGYHGHCNETCSGISSCGDGVVGKDEFCEPGPLCTDLDTCSTNTLIIPCNKMKQFKETNPKTYITECNAECMPILTDCENADSYEIPFFDTKQAYCYNNAEQIDCPAEGYDFYGQSPQFSYKTQIYSGNEDVVIVSGELVWQKVTPGTYDGCATGSECTFDEARNYCENLILDDATDWRLPSALELPTIADFSAADHIYSGFTGGVYWTAEGGIFKTAEGTVTQGHTGTAKVKCVRAFSVTGNIKPDVVVQYSTALMMHFRSSDSYAIWDLEDITETTWKEAFDICNGVDTNGLNKMRLPTVNELITLIDTVNGGSLISGFHETVWTSTTWNNDVSQAYVVDFSSLNLTTAPKTNSHFVICVE